MEKTLDQRILKIVKNFKIDNRDKSFESLEKAIIDFDEMIEKGLLKKRGNNLLSITDSHLHRSTFNKSSISEKNAYSSNL